MKNDNTITVDDECRIVADASGVHPELIGLDCTVIAPLEARHTGPALPEGTRTFLIRCQGHIYGALPEELQLKRSRG